MERKSVHLKRRKLQFTENIRYHLKKLTDDGVICRFESGVYYIPKINIFGEQSSLSAETVALQENVW